MEVREFTQMQCLLWIIQTAKLSRASSRLSSMTILHVLLQKKPKISLTRPSILPIPQKEKTKFPARTEVLWVLSAKN